MKKRFELSIAPTYVRDWGFVEAVRELFQNAIDQESTCPEQKMIFQASPTGILIGNEGAKLDKATMLLGMSTKHTDDLIGQFGEGYKLAMLVLARLGYEVIVSNSQAKEIWTPKIVYSQKYHSSILVIDVEKDLFTSRGNLIFTVWGLKEGDYERLVSSILLLRDYPDHIATNRGNILTSPEFRGSIYIKGLLITKSNDPKIRYGYDFKPQYIRLERDRKMVSDFDLYWVTSQIWAALGYCDRLKEMLHEGSSDITYLRTVYNSDSAAVLQDFWSQYGPNSIPVSDQMENDFIIKSTIGLKPVIVPKVYRDILHSSNMLDDLIRMSRAKDDRSLHEMLVDFLEKYEQQYFSDEMKQDFKVIIEKSLNK